MDKKDVGIWHRIVAEENASGSITEAMNVSGGCVIRTKTKLGSVAQTLLLNMKCVKTQDDRNFPCYKLEPGVVIP